MTLAFRCSTLASAILIILTASFAAAEPTVLYVAPNGNDAWPGTLEAPNAEGTDGPKATIGGARDALRALRNESPLQGGTRVLVRGGEYFVTEPITFTPEDTGAIRTPITYAAYPGETPVLHAGRKLTGWQQEGDVWVVDIPACRDEGWRFGSLWINGKRATPARTPNPANPAGDYPEESDYFYLAKPYMEKDAAGKESRSATRFYYRPGDLKAWDSLEDAVFVVFHSWETALMRPKAIDEENRLIEFTGPTSWGFGRWRPDQRYFVQHLREALDQPGEWFLDGDAGKLYYMPFPDEDMTACEAVAPVGKQLLRLDGIPAENKTVEYLTFRGLTFQYTDYLIEPQGHSDGQAAASVGGAIETYGARYCAFEDCTVTRVGTYGVWFREGSQCNRLEQCEIADLGAGGVRIGETGSPDTDAKAVRLNVVDNCFIHDGGHIFRGAVGMWIGRSSNNTVSHCEICDFRYTGISLGWSWGYAPSSANGNIIEYNRVHHVAKGQLSDTGAIYMLGASPGTIVRNNVFHDVMSNPRVSSGWGIYFDEGSTHILAENNVVYNTYSGSLHQHYGRENRVRNNIMAYSHKGQLIRSRPEEHISFFFERNIVYFNNSHLLGSNWDNDWFYIDNNCYWDTSYPEIDFAGATLEEWQARGNDVHSIVADPLFIAPKSADFRLRPESPALKLGFQPIDTSNVGLYGDPEWTEKPNQLDHPPFQPPRPPEPITVDEGFEDTPVDSNAVRAHTMGEEKTAFIHVTGETAAEGQRSLKVQDAKGLQRVYNPHLVYSPGLRRGTVEFTVALRVEPGAHAWIEWRDHRNPYRVGPSVHVMPNGELTAGDSVLLTAPQGEWFRLNIQCALGKDADGTYNLSVTLPGQDPREFPGLPCGTKTFARFEWLGFVSLADADTVFYIDDLHFAEK